MKKLLPSLSCGLIALVLTAANVMADNVLDPCFQTAYHEGVLTATCYDQFNIPQKSDLFLRDYIGNNSGELTLNGKNFHETCTRETLTTYGDSLIFAAECLISGYGYNHSTLELKNNIKILNGKLYFNN